TLETLRAAGLGSITGGGAEIFEPAVRDAICRGKETAAEWLDVHRIWHSMGGRSTCTMLYGHIETLAQRVDHLRQLRELQDETGGFTGFVPFAFEPQTTVLAHIKPASAIEQLRNLAVSRIYLDNIGHLTAYWVSTGLPLAQVSLSYGVDDLHGTILEEKIFHMAGATTPQQQTIATLEHVIREAARNPIYRIVDDVSISSAGPVYSVIVAHQGEISQVEEIELDPAAETSVNLLRCLLAELNVNPRFVPKSTASIPERRARLLIGDQAIRFRQKHEKDFHFWDLAEQWAS